jgi:rSAM/selenodomain-associated transferase 1
MPIMRAVVLLARAPSAPGKTRLTSTLTRAAAIALRRALLLDTYEVVCTAGEPIIVAFTPADARAEIESLIAESSGARTAGSAVAFVPQREDGDLGDRMSAALVEAQRRGASRVLLIGSDLPTLHTAHLRDGFALLDRHDVVLGPAEDGGYYAIGVGSGALTNTARLFHGITWSTDLVLRETLAAAARADLSVALLPPWFDVDTRADLERVRSAERRAARHTREWLQLHSRS